MKYAVLSVLEGFILEDAKLRKVIWLLSHPAKGGAKTVEMVIQNWSTVLSQFNQDSKKELNKDALFRQSVFAFWQDTQLPGGFLVQGTT